jgi:hypothetical protein
MGCPGEREEGLWARPTLSLLCLTRPFWIRPVEWGSLRGFGLSRKLAGSAPTPSIALTGVVSGAESSGGCVCQRERGLKAFFAGEVRKPRFVLMR